MPDDIGYMRDGCQLLLDHTFAHSCTRDQHRDFLRAFADFFFLNKSNKRKNLKSCFTVIIVDFSAYSKYKYLPH